jgi:hypothetical protein
VSAAATAVHSSVYFSRFELLAFARRYIGADRSGGGVEVTVAGFVDDVAAVTRGQHKVMAGDRAHVGEAMPEGVTREFRHDPRVGQDIHRRVS